MLPQEMDILVVPGALCRTFKQYPAELGRVWSNDSEVNVSPKSEKRREKAHDDKARNI
jgi:hypothetical protein